MTIDFAGWLEPQLALDPANLRGPLLEAARELNQLVVGKDVQPASIRFTARPVPRFPATPKTRLNRRPDTDYDPHLSF